jgi:2-polyprenyl-3-methyl-5-hydroxy-6-metoxy-1,4-benzoquinol methylase
MAVRTDPEGNETRVLFELTHLDGAEVLEIGCGDGRLTRRYADQVARVTAIDSFADAIDRARQWLPEKLKQTVEFRTIAFEDFARASGPDVFDLAILSWSLC